MNSKGKRIKKLSETRGDLKLKEVKIILRVLGYSLKRVKGSHHIFKNINGKVISLPVHNNKIKNSYLKYIIHPND